MNRELSLEKLKIGETYFKLDLQFNIANIEKLQRTLQRVTSEELRKIQFGENLQFEIIFEKGSTKAKIVFFAALNAIIFWADLCQSVELIYNQIKTLSSNVITSARNQDPLIDNNIIRTEKRTALTGRLKRTLDRIEYLQANLNNIGNNQIQAELKSLYQDLSNIIALLDLIERETFINALPLEISQNLPEPNNVLHFRNLYAIRPEED